jgi:uncharacterized protein (TIGR00251 family)
MDAVQVRLNAPPVDGQANSALMTLISDVLKVSKSRLELVSGQQSRRKQIAVETDEPEAVLERLALSLKTTVSEAFTLNGQTD